MIVDECPHCLETVYIDPLTKSLGRPHKCKRKKLIEQLVLARYEAKKASAPLTQPLDDYKFIANRLGVQWVVQAPISGLPEYRGLIIEVCESEQQASALRDGLNAVLRGGL